MVRSNLLPPTKREALLVPANGGAPEVLDLPTTVSERIDVSSDGKRLAFVAGPLTRAAVAKVFSRVRPGTRQVRTAGR